MPISNRFKTLATFSAGLIVGGILVGGLWIAALPGNAAPNAAKPFPDVPANHWAAKSVAKLKAAGIVQGEPDGDYNGNKFVTRYEAAVLIDHFIAYVQDGAKPLHVSELPAAQMPHIAPGFAHKAQTHLAQAEYAAPNSPLFKGSGDKPLTAAQFTTVISQAVNQVTNRAIPPSH